MDNDDQQVGRILSRREVLALFGAASAVVLAGCAAPQAGTTRSSASASTALASPGLNAEAATAVATATANPGLSATADAAATTTGALPACVVSPELTEGPYFIDTQLNRSDVRIEPSDNSVRAGVPLALTVRVSQIGSGNCTPLVGAIVDVWQCDAEGVYSGVTDRSQGFSTVEQKFLRGYQTTDSNGLAQFTTIYPGWYPGRTVHIHFKVRTTGADGQDYEFTSQFFFDDDLSDQVFAQVPYAAKGQRDTLNSNDGIYRESGDQLLLALNPASDGGYATTFDIGLDLSDTGVGAADGGQGGGPGGPPPRP
jgi:protocatechuate 3,4-dioxygenase beta subunit